MNDEELANTYARAFGENARPWSARSFNDLRKDPTLKFLTASHGALIGRIIADEAEIITIFVDPAHQRKGQAQVLLNRFITICQNAKVASIFLEVAISNPTARAFYQKNNFKPQGLRKKYYKRKDGRFEDAEILCLSLIDAQ